MITSNELARIQKRLLEMGKAVCDILEANEIPYMIAYGSLLGAVRHGGFIPWDDDFDIHILDSEYDRALSVLAGGLPDSMFLEYFDSEPMYFHGWAHIKDLHTIAEFTLYPQDNSYEHKGIHVDVFRMKRMERRDLENYLNLENSAYIERRRALGLISEAEYERRKSALEADIAHAAAHPSESREDILGLVSPYSCKYYLYADVFPMKKYAFEDAEFYGPKNGDKILTDIYGDYMTLPPVEKRKPHHFTSVIFKSSNN